MKYGMVGTERREAQRGLKATCLRCGDSLVAKYGTRTFHYWEHQCTSHCDPWRESESEWHRKWKNEFPADWNERIRQDGDTGEKHIADIITDVQSVVAFQDSPITREQRIRREAFFRPMIWIANGLKREWDNIDYFTAINQARPVHYNPLLYLINPENCALLRDWEGSIAPTYLDFGPTDAIKLNEGFLGPILWLLHPRRINGGVGLTPVMRSEFINALREGRSVQPVRLELPRRIVISGRPVPRQRGRTRRF